MAASYLFEELYLQGVLTSDFFLDDKKFLHGISGRPNPERMSHFVEALTRARELAKARQKTNPNDGEALFALTLAAGMESDAESILQKRRMDGLKRMKEANKYAEVLLARDPDVTDAYIALGIRALCRVAGIASCVPVYRTVLPALCPLTVQHLSGCQNTWGVAL